MEAAYLFEAKAIQKYLFSSGKLRDVIGASEIIASLARFDGKDLVAEVLEVVSLKIDDFKFSRRASGAFVLHASQEGCEQFRQLWRLTVASLYPGLEFSDALVVDETNKLSSLQLKDEVYQAGNALRTNSASHLYPSAHGLMQFVPRTGRVAVDTRKLPGGESEFLDAVITPQHHKLNTLNKDQKNEFGVASRFLPDDKIFKELYRFPRNLDDNEKETISNPIFPFEEDNRWIAFVHADISGLGQVYTKIGQAIKTHSEKENVDVTLLAKISGEIELAITRAAQQATLTELLSTADSYEIEGKYKIPARPLVLGGDDLTIIVRADLALDYAYSLLVHIELETKKAFDELSNREGFEFLKGGEEGPVLPPYLTACAGVAFAKSTQPFLMANEMAEELCSFAKKDVKSSDHNLKEGEPFPSALSFYVISNSLQEGYKDKILPRELTSPSGQLTMQPLYLSGHSRATYEKFKNLIEALKQADKGIGKLKEIRSLLFFDIPQAKKLWQRWVEVCEKDGIDLSEVFMRLGDFYTYLPNDVKRSDFHSFVFPENQEEIIETPLFDALQMIDFELTPPKHTSSGVKPETSEEV
jgi:hypothetical protein